MLEMTFLLHKAELTCQKHSSNICKHINCENVAWIELFVAGDKHHFDICNHLLAAEQLQLPTHGAGRTFLLLLIEKCYLFTEETNTKIYNVYYTCQCVSLWNVSILYYTIVDSNKYSQIYIKHNKCVDSNLYLHWRCRLMELRCEQWSQESTGTLSQVLKT